MIYRLIYDYLQLHFYTDIMLFVYVAVWHNALADNIMLWSCKGESG